LASKRTRKQKRNDGAMAKFGGPQARQRRRRIFRTRRRFGWGWVRRLPLLWLGALAACAFLIYFVTGSGIFSVRTVLARNLSPQDVDAITARCQCIGANIFVVKSDEIRSRLVEGLPTLVVQRVYTRLPNQVVVEAYHKQIVAIWRTPEAGYGVDATGEVLRVWKHPLPRHWSYPLFDDTQHRARRYLVGQMLPSDPLAMALNVRARLPKSLQTQIKGYVYTPFTGLVLHSKEGWWAFFGMDYSAKLDMNISELQNALAKELVPSQGCMYLSGDHPFTRKDHFCGS